MKYFLLVVSLLVFASSFAELSQLPTATAKYEETYQRRTLNGMIEAVHQATVSAQTSGRVIAMYYDVGDYVAKDSVLLRIRSETHQAKLDAAQAKYKREKAELERAQAMYKKKLFAKTELDKAKAAYKLAEAEFKQAQEDMQNTEIKAPYSGIVVKRFIEVGETAQPGQALMRGLSLESLRVVVEVPQSLIQSVRKFQQARVKHNNKVLAVSALTISPYADPKSHSFTVKADIPKGEHGVYPGMYVKIEFITGKTKKLIIPASSVIQRGEVIAVYVFDKNNNMTMRQVRTGKLFEHGKIEILSGLDAGERVAIDPISASNRLKSEQLKQKH